MIKGNCIYKYFRILFDIYLVLNEYGSNSFVLLVYLVYYRGFIMGI